MGRTFTKFPEQGTCPICGTNRDGECFLLPIDGTDKDNICEAQPTHTDCFDFDKFRFNKEHQLVYLKL